MADNLKICFVSSEIVPFAKTGGLADVSGALGKYIHQKGHDIRLFMPYYSTIDTANQKLYPVEFLQNIPVEFGGFTITFSVFTAKLPNTAADVYFIQSEALYNRDTIYTEHSDEYLRFALLSRAVIVSCQYMGWGPDVFHCNDWQNALIPLYLKTHYGWDKIFAKSKTMLTIHNIGYQGIFSANVIDKLQLSGHRHTLPQEDLTNNTINYLKIGVLYADVITTVSETYATEIQTEEYGAGLDKLLRFRSDSLTGILNGIDYSEWSPESDPYIPHHYSMKNISGKKKMKKALLERMNLPFDANVPVYAVITRLTPQKGLELLHEILFDVLSYNELRFIILGSGDVKYVQFLERASSHFPDKLAFYNGYNIELSHWIEAGSDIFVMPSRYEPCGLNQIYSLKYGTVPIVRKTGGLADTVVPYNNGTKTSGTGFVFEKFNGDSLRWAMSYAYETFKNKDAWRKIMKNGMSQNFSWDKQADKYIELYALLSKK